jgi:hypothetical protein
MVVSVEEVLNFATEDVPQLIKAMEVLRVSLVRLASRNRHLSKREDILIINQDEIQTARQQVRLKNSEGWIDSDGRRFIYVPKIQNKVTEGILSKKKKKRPTHRGKRKRSQNMGIVNVKLSDSVSSLPHC